MNYDYIWNYNFKIYDQNQIFKTFCLNDFDYIDNYLCKYPSKWAIKTDEKLDENTILFWTMRDMNALKRSQTFVSKFGTNTIIVDKKKLIYYIYTDVCKDFLGSFPYYFGNCNIPINSDLFAKYQKFFILYSVIKHPKLLNQIKISTKKDYNLTIIKSKIDQYFQLLLQNHYVY